MANITPTTTVNPTTMVNNWSAGLASPTNQQKLVNKYLNPKVLFNANPAASQASWQTGVTRAIQNNKYQSGMQNADTAAAATNMQNYGGTNWGTAGTTKKYKYQAKSVALAAAITSVQATVQAMPTGKGANNQARMLAWFNGMSAYYGKI